MINKLKRWLSGDADWKAEQHLDQLGKEDSFLGDALEGYRSMPESDHVQAVKDLKAKLNNRTKKKRRIIPWMRIGAAAAVIGVVGMFFWTQRDLGNSNIVADTTELSPKPEQSSPTVIEKDMSGSLADESLSEQDSVEVIPEEFEERNPQIAFVDAGKRENKLKVDPDNIEAGVITKADLEQAELEPSEPIVVVSPPDAVSGSEADDTEADTYLGEAIALEESKNSDIAKKESAAPAAPVISANDAAFMDTAKTRAAQSKEENLAESKRSQISELESPILTNTLTGTIIEEASSEPLIGVNVLIKDTDEGTITGISGEFTLESNQPLPWTILISYTGYSSQELQISDVEAPIMITLDESGMVLSEVVVTGYGARKKSKSTASSGQSPKPQSNFRKLKRHIRKNMKYPEAAKLNNVEGKVTVRFLIDGDGNPTQLSITKSLGFGCDEEAIRLIKEGPKWKPGNKWANYTIEFKL